MGSDINPGACAEPHAPADATGPTLAEMTAQSARNARRFRKMIREERPALAISNARHAAEVQFETWAMMDAAREANRPRGREYRERNP